MLTNIEPAVRGVLDPHVNHLIAINQLRPATSGAQHDLAAIAIARTAACFLHAVMAPGGDVYHQAVHPLGSATRRRKSPKSCHERAHDDAGGIVQFFLESFACDAQTNHVNW